MEVDQLRRLLNDKDNQLKQANDKLAHLEMELRVAKNVEAEKEKMKEEIRILKRRLVHMVKMFNIWCNFCFD